MISSIILILYNLYGLSYSIIDHNIVLYINYDPDMPYYFPKIKRISCNECFTYKIIGIKSCFGEHEKKLEFKKNVMKLVI